MKQVVMFSGGLGSFCAAKRVIARHGPEQVTLLFADTLIEDADLYRFLDEAVAALGATFVRLAEGRTPWQVFFDTKFLGNSRIDPCSRILKRDFLRKYLNANFAPADTIVHLGIDWTESHRFEAARHRWAPYPVEAPLCEPPYLSKEQMRAELGDIALPRLYAMGFPHNNCGGFCVKAGQAHFKRLLEKLPERYAEHEAKEQEFREFIGKDVSIMLDHRGGVAKPLTLKALRERAQQGGQIDPHEWGGCGCVA